MLPHKVGMLDQSGETLLGLFALLLDLCELGSVLDDQALESFDGQSALRDLCTGKRQTH